MKTMNQPLRQSSRIRLTLAALAASGLLGPIGCLADAPARSWLSLWENTNNQFDGGSVARNTTARILNPANPGDPASLPAHVTVTFFLSGCWGPVAAQETMTIPPGQFGSYSSLLAGYPASLAGNGCLWIESDVPVLPMNGRIEDGLSFSNGESSQWTLEAGFWRATKTPAARWTSYWEHVTPLGGSEFGGISTSGWVLNPARQSSRTQPLPDANVTVTFHKGACGTGPVWKQVTMNLAPGKFGLFYSQLLSGDDTVGAGCLAIESDQPVVPLHGSLSSGTNNPVSGQRSATAAALTFHPMSSKLTTRNWLSEWDHGESQYSGGGSLRYTSGRLLNAADPADPVAPTANVTVTFYQGGCWGQIAAQTVQAIPPGKYGTYSTLLAAYPDVLYGGGCLSIRSDVPIVPVNGRTYDNVSNLASGETAEMAWRNDFWRAGKPGATAWVTHFEHSIPLGGPQFGGRFTGGSVFNVARQNSRKSSPRPPAHVTITHYNGMCGAPNVWKTEQFELGPGAKRGYDSFPATDASIGQGCVWITSDQPIVAFNGATYSHNYNPVSGQHSESATAITYQPVDW